MKTIYKQREQNQQQHHRIKAEKKGRFQALRIDLLSGRGGLDHLCKVG